MSDEASTPPKIPMPPEIYLGILTESEKHYGDRGRKERATATLLALTTVPEEMLTLQNEIAGMHEKWTAKFRQLAIKHEAAQMAKAQAQTKQPVTNP